MEHTVAVEHRKEQRYGVFIKVVAKEISQFPGCVLEVSKTGCRIEFQDVEDVDFESEYSATMYPHPSGNDGGAQECFELVITPRWITRNGTSAIIGFTVLCTPGYRGFVRFVERVAAADEDSETFAD